MREDTPSASANAHSESDRCIQKTIEVRYLHLPCLVTSGTADRQASRNPKEEARSPLVQAWRAGLHRGSPTPNAQRCGLFALHHALPMHYALYLRPGGLCRSLHPHQWACLVLQPRCCRLRCQALIRSVYHIAVVRREGHDHCSRSRLVVLLQERQESKMPLCMAWHPQVGFRRATGTTTHTSGRTSLMAVRESLNERGRRASSVCRDKTLPITTSTHPS